LTEIVVSILVAAIIAFIVWRYRTVFCLPFYWAALFACIYVGLLQIRAQSGGSSYLYFAEGFGVYFLGLLAADILFFFRPAGSRIKNRDQRRSRNSHGPNPKPAEQSRPTRIRLLFPTLPLNVALFVSLCAATLVTILFFANQGFPIFASNPALAWVQSTSGIGNRLMTIFGPSCYANLGLMAWAVHRETGSRAAKVLMYLGLGLAIIGQGLLATKSAAIMVFVWFNILLYYMNKKRDLLRTILPLIIIVVPVSSAIVAVRMMSSQGYWEAGGISQTYYSRLTTIAAEPLDFTFKYMDRFGAPMHDRPLRLEMKRINEQLTGAHKTPILSEYVYNLMMGLPPGSLDLTVTLTLQGTGYIEWGMAGLFLYSFFQGLGFGFIHRLLLRQESMNLISLVLWSTIVTYAITISMTGIVLVGIEGLLLAAIPPLALLLPVCVFMFLPMARRYRISAGERVPSIPQM
jgi:oligosaccharide repeat unit polymerase